MANASKQSGIIRVFTLMLSGGLLTTLIVYGSTTAGCKDTGSPTPVTADTAADTSRAPSKAEQKPASEQELDVGNEYMGTSKAAPVFSPRPKTPPSNSPTANAPANANAKP